MRSDSVARILLVGHNPSSRDLYAWALDDAGRDVLSAEPDNSLVECVGYAAPDVVVIDTGRYPPAARALQAWLPT